MATKTVTITATAAAYVSELSPFEHLTVGETVMLSERPKKAMLMRFVVPDAIKDKRTSLYFVFKFYPQNSGSVYADVYANESEYDPQTITFSNYTLPIVPILSRFLSSGEAVNLGWFEPDFARTKDLIKYGVTVMCLGDEAWNTPNSSSPPTMQLEYSDDISFYGIGGMSPKATYKSKATVLSWSLYDTDNDAALIPGTMSPYGIIEVPTQTAATVKWRTASGNTEHSISVTTAQSVTIPADTFTTDTVEWMVTATYSNGMELSTSWQELSTVDAIPATRPLYPIATMIDSSIDNVFAWDYKIDSGTQPSGFTIQQSTDGATWTTLAEDLDSHETTYTVPADTLPAGNFYWRVKGYNADGVAGAYSAAASNIVAGASPTPSVSVINNLPMPTFIWQTTGQQGYEIEVDGTSSGIKYGTKQDYTWPDCLTDGGHVARVRVQNVYGIWSKWGSATFDVANTPGDAIQLTAYSGMSAELNWTTAGEYSSFMVCRDGAKIAEVAGTTYTDDMATGDVSYQVRGVKSGNYTLSNTAQLSITIDTVIIKPDGGEWLILKTVATSARTNSMTHSQDVAYHKYAGATYPMAVIGKTRNKTYAFAVAFRDRQTSKLFEALLGSVVVLKDAWGNVIRGVLDGYSLESTRFYQSYSCTIQQVANG